MNARGMALAIGLIVVLGPLAPEDAAAHGVQHEVSRGEATVVTLRYADGTPFAQQDFEIRREGATTALAAGRTDASGRAVFLAPEPGRYSIAVHAHDGHGSSFTFTTEGAATAEATIPRDASSLPAIQMVVGAALILGFFLLLSRVARPARDRSAT